ncbi:hypothetical protein EOE67_02140 [Rheinheimera riviphila]|uniref:Lipase chaperone n=1 Tax=Rheinheimera riviphila TaxID=1834037 RepID=A0A437R5R1_9GAMM|nr:lipase secretion chaperone [Rheinheimera riviphila]RVU42007.1 hypothetical protein EOE67_02140 [Rheinheimera riviphila]
MKNKLGVAGLTLLAVSAMFWWQPPAADDLTMDDPSPVPATQHQPATTVTPADPMQSATTMALVPEEESLVSTRERKAEQLRQQVSEYRRLHQAQPGNLQAWLDRLWQQCRDIEASKCQPLADLASELSSAELAELQRLLKNYQQYQQQLSQLTMSTDLTSLQRFEQVKTLRQQLFGALTETLFGQEHQYAAYQFAVQDLQDNEAPHLSVSQRLDKLAQLQQQLRSAEPGLISPDSAYQQALLLLGDLPPAERADWQQQLRARYFGKDAAAVEAFETLQHQQQVRMQAYQTELLQLEQHFATLKSQQADASWQHQYAQALTALRLKHFPD